MEPSTPSQPSQKTLIAAIVFAAIMVSGSLVFFALKSSSNTADLLKENPKLSALLQELEKEEGILNVNYDEVVDDDASLGDKNAPVTLVEFSDYQCPFCRRHYMQTFPLIKKNLVDTGKVRFIFRDYPLSFHAAAIPAAMAAECVREEQGDSGYYAMHAKIFDGQQKLGSGTVDIPTDDLKQYARDLKADMNQFLSCLETSKYRAEIENDIQQGSRYGIGGTPGFVITNGKSSKRIDGAQPYSVFEAEVEALL